MSCSECFFEMQRLRDALVKIKDGGVALGVQATVAERMLAMCEIANEALTAQSTEN